MQRDKKRRIRRTKDRFIFSIMCAATALIVFALALIVVYIVYNGIGTLSFGFIFSDASERGIFAMVVTTFYVVLTSLALALPVGIITAVFLTEYSGRGRSVQYIRLAIETLAGIPSILYGLFGLLMFARLMGFGQSIIAGGLTLSIMVLPVIIRTTEESLKTVPIAFREGSLALGTTQWQTIHRVVLPSALPGIVTASILAIGRVVGEAAPVLLTVGIARNLPRNIFQSGRTLTIHLYHLTKEALNPQDFEIAFATATVLVIFVIIVNATTRVLSSNFKKRMEQ